jgi:signal transduction histidine kinase
MTTSNDILIVDDIPENLRVLGDMLRRHGYKVRPVPSGALALKACAAQAPDIILLDINMPEMNGYEVCARLKEDPQLKEIPVLFISALSESDDKVKAFRSGGVDYITKPFQIEEVEARVATHLSLHRQKKELQQNYDCIRELEDLRKSLTRLIVHDLRNPLIAIKAFLEVVTERNPDLDADSKKHLRLAHGASRQLIDMANSLLDIDRLEEGVLRLKTEQVDLAELCREAIESSSSLLDKRTVTVETGQEPPVAEVDRSLMLRVIQNILGNALKYTDRNTGIITMRAELSGEDAVVTLFNNGPAIPHEYHQRIFERFAQVDGQQIPGVHCTGLGLSLVKLGVEAHGGTVGVESEVGKGTTFRLTLPYKRPAPVAS